MAMSEQLTSSRFPFLPIRLEVRQETYEDEALWLESPSLALGQLPDVAQIFLGGLSCLTRSGL